MQNACDTAHLRSLILSLPLLLMGLTGCESLKLGDGQSQAEKDEAMLAAARNGEAGVPVKAATSPVDLSFLLSMDYKEAKAISAQSVELPSGARIAADSIEIVKTTRDGQPRKVRAKGKVYIETGAADGAKILCQEALIDGSEAILRGKPILQRGGSIVEGLDEGTVFYLMDTSLRVIGLHRLTNQNSMIASLPDLGPWTGGPNPLLPPLTENAVPRDIRAEMLKAAEAEAVLQEAKLKSDELPDAPPAPWIKTSTKKATPAPAANSAGEPPAPAKGQQAAPEAASPASKPKRKASAVTMRR